MFIHSAQLIALLTTALQAWFTLPMSTGGLTLLLSPEMQPHTFRGLQTIGKVVYIIDLVIFTSLVAAISYRFIRWPKTLPRSLSQPRESMFVCTMFLSLASIIAAIARYGIPSCGPWLVVTYRVLFWIYFAVTFCVAVVFYLWLFISAELQVENMTPAWDLPIFPFMLSGTIAATGASLQPRAHAIAMIVGGTTAQGLGFFISILMFAMYMRRMIEYGLPSTSSRPAMFIAVGPPAFTSLAIIGMANAYPTAYEYFGPGQTTLQVVKVIATVTSIFMWSLSFWFFCIAALTCLLAAREMRFSLNWWAFVFPNVGFTIATITIGRELQSQGILWVGSIATILMVILYLFIAVMHIRAVLTRQILFKGQDEDVPEEEARPKKTEKVKIDAEDQC
ncbi:hypothetical protein N7468_000935 [Penicillium chermesinum]|uniref:C4-dicarboxylate transporter/malic acid transport protein n=1 Tax=Penicillium chermesinum TaxID=63820 RepID=A0A9W9PIN2_9EURO|nr:uncharacterized protein N7468_000935 [Penicillium chermesinum]KAJ5245952.1 hypothetical protein N7468_000935 [Penicillium chermesinum]KAJ6144248.1 hypothetical protein N7470_008143 [Penicillium chermesinum]